MTFGASEDEGFSFTEGFTRACRFFNNCKVLQIQKNLQAGYFRLFIIHVSWLSKKQKCYQEMFGVYTQHNNQSDGH